MDTFILIFVIFIFTFIIGFGVYEYIDTKHENERRRKEQEEYERKMKDPEYRKQKLQEFLDGIDHFNKHYSPGMDLSGPSHYTSSHSYHDDFWDPSNVMSPLCPWGIYNQ